MLASDRLEARFDADTGELISLVNRAAGPELEMSVISPLRIEFADDTLVAASASVVRPRALSILPRRRLGACPTTPE